MLVEELKSIAAHERQVRAEIPMRVNVCGAAGCQSLASDAREERAGGSGCFRRIWSRKLRDPQGGLPGIVRRRTFSQR